MRDVMFDRAEKMRNSLILALLLIIEFPFVGLGEPRPRPLLPRQRILLDKGWQFREVSSTRWYPATVPGCVHTDLLQNELIEDPFFQDNEAKLQWIDKTMWIYRTSFSPSPELLMHQNVELVFEGLDTYATVFLNGNMILRTDNMFRQWRVLCKGLLKPHENTLLIEFSSPINKVLPSLRLQKHPLPAANDRGEKTSPYTRKAPYQYGWDWGPRLVSSGIWKPVYLEGWDDARIADLHIQQTALSVDQALVRAEVELEASGASEVQVVLDSPERRFQSAQATVLLPPGKSPVGLEVSVPQPNFWWPNGMGAHPMYRFRVTVFQKRKNVDELEKHFGFRTVQLRQSPDAWGTSFQFIVNGVPVFAKGGNWIPADIFPSRVISEKYRQLLEACQRANMNMLRVWGGGFYESDTFYGLCDELGLMVWQDFPFAGSLYPMDEAFLANVRQEALDNIRRLRGHPSLALWCGNNEVETGWFDWGWKKRYPVQFWEGYMNLFHGILPKALALLDTSRAYWPSSPSSNLEDSPNSQKMGDVHFWGVWHGDLPYEAYEKQFPRFMSEYGFQSFPPIATIESFAVAADLSVESSVMSAHQKNVKGNQRILDSVLRYYAQPKDFESLVYLSQLLQAEAIKTGAEHLRRNMPRSMGSLYWQINDCWPAVSWSSLDYFGRWKALHYYAKKFYNNLLVSLHEADGQISIYVVSDLAKAVSGQLQISIRDFNGQVLLQNRKKVVVEPRVSKIYCRFTKQELLQGRIPTRVFLHCELQVDGQLQTENSLFFEPPKRLALLDPHIVATIEPGPHGMFHVELSASQLAKNVFLSCDKFEGLWSDNYFDLIPGRPAQVEFQPERDLSLPEIQRRLRVGSLVDAFK